MHKKKPISEKRYTIGEYLDRERKAFERSEYIDGYIYPLDGEIQAMAGESHNHGRISMNLSGIFFNELKNTNCEGRIKDAKIQTGDFEKMKAGSVKGMFSYPDLVVICGEPEYHDEHKDIILNPKVIIEVLSQSTELFDRNTKFHRYGKFNETLTDYVLVSQDKPLVEHFVRQKDGNWKLFVYFGIDETFEIKNIKCQLKLKDVYDRVEFSEEALEFLSEIKNAEKSKS